MSKAIKRSADILVATALLLFLSPVLMACAIAVLASVGSPVLFRQVRPGKDGKPFTLLKFRTMRNETGLDGILLPDSFRLTRVGRFLRRTSLDELPSLWNVLKGDMSLVGPRPLLTEYLSRYTETQSRRHNMRPGITGLAQISGRQDIPFSRRLELDVYYVDNWSLSLDVKILAMTAVRAVQGSGVRSGQNVLEVDDLGLSQANLTEQGEKS